MGLREQKKKRTRADILKTCEHLFRSRGFDETTICEITEQVGVSRQTFFNYFSSKQDVLTEIGLQWLGTQALAPRRGAQSARAREGHALAGMREAVRRQMRAVEADRDFMRLVFTRSGALFSQGAASGKSLDATRRSRTRVVYEGVTELIRVAREAGEVRDDVDPAQVAEIYVSTMLVTARLWLIDYWQSGQRLEERAMSAHDLLLSGFSAQPRGRGPRPEEA